MLLHCRELAKAIDDCRQAVDNAHKTALKARQRFDDVGLQGTLGEHRAEVEKDKLLRVSRLGQRLRSRKTSCSESVDSDNGSGRERQATPSQ